MGYVRRTGRMGLVGRVGRVGHVARMGLMGLIGLVGLVGPWGEFSFLFSPMPSGGIFVSMSPFPVGDFFRCRAGAPQRLGIYCYESDRVMAFARSGSPNTWCGIYGMSKNASFSFSKYEKEPCSVLALRWCAVNQYYFNIWRRQEDPHYAYTSADVGGLPVDEKWVEFLHSLPEAGPARSRAQALDALQPKAPRSDP